MSGQLGFYVNLSMCSGCKACQIACKDKNNVSDERLWRKVATVETGEWVKRGDAWLNSVSSYSVSTACNHCANPVCVEVCPTGAMTQRADGIVSVNQDLCIGCRYCEWACPYGAPQFNAELGVMTKCDLCVDFIDAGQSPACVSACQMRVLEVGDIEELRAKYGTLAEVSPLSPAGITNPSVVFTPHRGTAVTAGSELTNAEEL